MAAGRARRAARRPGRVSTRHPTWAAPRRIVVFQLLPRREATPFRLLHGVRKFAASPIWAPGLEWNKAESQSCETATEGGPAYDSNCPHTHGQGPGRS